MAASQFTGPWSDKWILSPECGRYIENERRRLAQELWELREEWPHRVEMRDRANAVLWPLFCRLGIKNCASCHNKKGP